MNKTRATKILGGKRKRNREKKIQGGGGVGKVANAF